MKRIKYIIIMAAVLVTAVCFMITFSRKNQAVKPTKCQKPFVFADKAESEGIIAILCSRIRQEMHYSVFTAPIAMVLQKYMKSNSHIRRFFGSMARECILYKIFMRKNRYGQRFTRYRIRRNLWKSKPMSSKAVWWEPTCRENICGL